MNQPPHWTRPGRPARVAGYDIPGGLIYIGQYLYSAVGGTEPALINPGLPVGQPDQRGHDIAPEPSYHLISPAGRAGYLAWLAGGRRQADAPIGFVSLFFAGLERRVLVDLAADPAVRPELPAIATEVRGLRAVYGPASRSFDSSAGAFLDVLELLGTSGSDPGPAARPPAAGHDRWPVPIALRTGLARFARTGAPVPADWARSWVWYHPSLFPRTPQTRCPEQFDRLFARRYTGRFGAGLVASAAGRTPVRIGYQPRSPGIDAVVLDRPDLPDVLEEPRVTRELGALADSVTEALTPYSRWLARTPMGLDSLASTALLPDDLLDRDGGPLGQVLAWADGHLGGASTALVEVGEFGAFWSTADPYQMTKDEAGGLAAILARVGLGVEPDVRFGGPALTAGPAVLFRLAPGGPDTPSAGYRTASTMLHLAAGILLGDPAGDVGTDLDDTVAELATEIPLSVTERCRLAAWLRWLFASGAAASVAGRRIAALTAAERDVTGRFLIAVATAAHPAGPATVTALTTAYRLLSLDPGLVFHRLHRRSAGQDGPPLPGAGVVDGPIVVRRGRPGPPGHELPRTPPDRRPRTGSQVRLDQAAITRKVAETQVASILLAGIFADEQPVLSAPAPTGRAATRTPSVPGILDEAHRGLLCEIATRSSWSRTDFAEAAVRHGVLPSGALDVINEAALEIAGEPAVEGDDELLVNDDVLEELLA